VLKNQGDLEGVLKECHKALETRERNAPNSWTVADSYNIIGGVLRDQGGLEGASKAYREALEFKVRVAGPQLVDGGHLVYYTLFVLE
jgi:hypothetical protein